MRCVCMTHIEGRLIRSIEDEFIIDLTSLGSPLWECWCDSFCTDTGREKEIIEKIKTLSRVTRVELFKFFTSSKFFNIMEHYISNSPWNKGWILQRKINSIFIWNTHVLVCRTVSKLNLRTTQRRIAYTLCGPSFFGISLPPTVRPLETPRLSMSSLNQFYNADTPIPTKSDKGGNFSILKARFSLYKSMSSRRDGNGGTERTSKGARLQVSPSVFAHQPNIFIDVGRHTTRSVFFCRG